MDATISYAGENQPRLRVSITARLITALSYTIPAIGGALSSILLMNVFRLLSANESAGIDAVMAGMKEASLPAIVTLYLAALCGIIVIVVLVVRMIVQTKTASPPIWFFAIGGILCLLPAGLFWKAQLLILEALSPGSSTAGGGLMSIGSDLSRLLMLSVIAAPIVFILLVAASVLPLSSRSKSRWGPLIAASAIEILLIAVAVAVPFFIDGPKRKNEIVNLPVNVEHAESDSDIEKDTSMILTLTSDNQLYERQNRNIADKVERAVNIITNEELPEKLKNFAEVMTPDRRIVYLKADVNAPYGNVLLVFDTIRKADIDKVGLVVVGEKNEMDLYQVNPLRYEVRLPAPLDNTGDASPKPNPLTLIAELEKDGKLKLNYEDMGTVFDSKTLENRLMEVFSAREYDGVFREGTNEIEKTVFLKVSKSTKYGDFIKLVQAVRGAGARPIGIQIDDVNL